MICSLALLLAGLSSDPGWTPFESLSSGSLETSREGDPRIRTGEFEGIRRVPEAFGGGPPQGLARTPQTTGFLTVNEAPEGDMPREVAFSMDGSEILTVQRDTDNVTFHDASTHMPTFTVPVGDFPVDVAVTPNNQFAVVPNTLDHSLSVIDMASHSVVGTVPLTGEQPFAVQVLPGSRFVLVALINDAVTSSVSIVDLLTLAEVRNFPTSPQGALGFFFSPESAIFGNLFTDFEMTPDGSRLVLADRPGGRVRVYEVSTGNVLADLPVAPVPGDVSVSADGQFALVEHGQGERLVTRIDLASLSVSGTFPMPGDLGARRIRVNGSGSHAFVGGTSEVYFLNLANGAIDATIPVGSVGDIEFTSDDLRALISGQDPALVDANTGALLASLPSVETFELAVAPTGFGAVGLSNRLGEDLQFYAVDGVAPAALEAIVAGQIVEADAPRSLCMSPDGSTLIVVNNTSGNVAIVDVESQSVRAYVETGARSLEAAISADGTRAVVTNGDADTATLIDLTTDTVLHTFLVPSRPAEVLLSPDGSTAFVTSVAGVDKVWFLDLAAPYDVTSLDAGQMGASFFTYNVFSGMALSPDGSVLAVCLSFDDELLLVDAFSRSVLTRVPVGSFPLRVAFTPDGNEAVVTNAFSDDVTIVDVDGGSSSVAGIVDDIGTPLQVDVDDTGSFAYVGSWAFGSAAIHVVDISSAQVVAEVPLGSSPRSSVLDGKDLWLTLTDGELALVRADGNLSSLTGVAPLSESPSDLALSSTFGVLFAAQPAAQDGLDVIASSQPQAYCIAAPNSTGSGALIDYSGTTSVSANDFVVRASGIPANVPLISFYGSNQVQVPFGNGLRCVGGVVQRLYPVTPAQPDGTFARALDFTTFPVGFGPKSIQPGSTWNFQVWYRDGMGGGLGFNLSDGLQATFQP